MSAPAWVEVMREARVPWAPGMKLLYGYAFDLEARVLEHVWNAFSDEHYDLGILGKEDEGRDIPEASVQDLRDWPTRMQCLRVLAERVGLDAEGGVTWSQQHTMWRVEIRIGEPIGTMPDEATSHRYVHFYDPAKSRPIGWGKLVVAPGVDTNDALLALALCLKATAPAAPEQKQKEGT